MPVRTVVEVRQDQSNEVVVLFRPTPHNLVDAQQTLRRFLPNNVLTVGQLLHD